ncbi:patatin family protein [Pseudonocardia benzenivorans]|jgi:predicted patatin/cPLA2 family phospholipase|uniref:Patatin n=2 Tax=Pseudonocardia TaxID=1847 RepID=F4CXN1_PSEUX|nr:patatin family protein [Pseudonocardia dioxanivorans]AEA27614.1 Patatin [Pseudonocardia dioxanivorans CB1190]
MHPAVPNGFPGDGPVLPSVSASTLSGDDEVIRALLRRREAGSVPGARTDGHRIACVIGGGGMRGAYAGGMVHALETTGLADAFDVVYGVSAGAFVGTALVLGHGYDSARIFPDDMACKEFIDPRRLGTRRPMVSLDHLIDDILVHVKPADWEALRDHPVPLRVLVTDAADMTSHVLERLPTREDWRRAMRATATIPWLAGPPVRIGDRRYIDGSISDPMPVLRALRDGATHVLALLTRTVPELRRSEPGTRPPLWARSIDVVVPGLGAMTQDVRRHADSLALLSDAAHPDRDGAHLMAITPARSAGVRGLTIDVPRIEQAVVLGREAVASALRAVSRG